MKQIRKSLCALFFAVVILCTLAISASAAGVSYYQTSKANVPIWSKASSSSTKVTTVEKKSTVLKIVSSTTNSAGNKWYKLQNGNWVYSGNVTKHTHKYSGGICTGLKCGYEYPLPVVSYKATFVVTNDNGASIWSRPYSTNSKKVRTADYNDVLKIVAKTINVNSKGEANNLWYKLDDGNWVYSDNVTRRYTIKYNANGGTGAPKTQYLLSGKTITLSSTKPTREGWAFKGWATTKGSSTVAYKSGAKYSSKKDITLYAVWKECTLHSYSGGICTKCSLKAPITLTVFTATMQVTNSKGTSLYSRPYYENSEKAGTAKYGERFTIVASSWSVNKNGIPEKLWYILKDGTWVYSGDVTRVYSVTYYANGGKKAPAKLYYLTGNKVKISSSIPVRDGYTFQGWSIYSDSSTVKYKPGKEYTINKTIKLYAVWLKCKHDYENSYGICKLCSYSYQHDLDPYKTVCTISNKNGTTTYKRPYSNPKEKVKPIAYKEPIYVTNKTVNANGATWCKLKDGSWIKASDIKKQPTSYNIGDIGYDYFDTFKNSITLKVLPSTAGGSPEKIELDSYKKKITGTEYYYFDKGNKPFYLSASAFEKESVNPKLTKISTYMTDALTERKSTTRNFIYNYEETYNYNLGPGFSHDEKFIGTTHFKHTLSTWMIAPMLAKANTVTSEQVYLELKLNSSPILLLFCDNCNQLFWVDYTYDPEIIPKFTISTPSPAKGQKNPTGYLTTFDLSGKGRGEKKALKVKDYLELISCGVGAFDSTVKVTKSPTISSVFNMIYKEWKFITTAKDFDKNKSADYKASNMSFLYEDEGAEIKYYIYEARIKSPIGLAESGDYLGALVSTYDPLGKKASIDAKITINTIWP